MSIFEQAIESPGFIANFRGDRGEIFLSPGTLSDNPRRPFGRSSPSDEYQPAHPASTHPGKFDPGQRGPEQLPIRLADTLVSVKVAPVQSQGNRVNEYVTNR